MADQPIDLGFLSLPADLQREIEQAAAQSTTVEIGPHPDAPETCLLGHGCEEGEACGCWCEPHDCPIASCPSFKQVTAWLAAAYERGVRDGRTALPALDVDRLAQAIGDPGSIVGPRRLPPRDGGDDDGQGETLTRWTTRAVLKVLTEQPAGRPGSSHAPTEAGVDLRYPGGRPGWLSEFQSWPCGRCGREVDDSAKHRCVPAAGTDQAVTG